MIENNYVKWFKKLINICIYLFFIFSFISNIFVYTSIFNGLIKYILFFVLSFIVILFIHFFKDKLKILINKFIKYISKLSKKKLLLIIVLSSLILKIIAYIFFFFDSTKFGGDITIYANLADSIVNNGLSSIENNIYYLIGMAMHLSIFKYINIPYHVGIYIVFLIGTIINYYSFSRLIGKEKTFILIELYLLMPSTSLLTFCITHELFVYLYFSIILFILNLYLNSEKNNIVLILLLFIFVTLNQTVSPIGKIWFIILFILVLLSNIKINKRITLLIVLVMTILSSNVVISRLEVNTQSQSNNVEQLLIGCDLNSMGRHTDGRGKNAAKKYWQAKGIELTYDNLVEGEKGALIEEYKYLFTHPLKLIELLANKFYVVWSGDFYSIEYGYHMESISSMAYYIMLIMSALIWLLVISIGIVYYDKQDKNISINTYKLLLLGIMSVLLITEVANKYSCYMTIFIYFIAFARTDLKGEDHE